jgi:hypothetical protein
MIASDPRMKQTDENTIEKRIKDDENKRKRPVKLVGRYDDYYSVSFFGHVIKYLLQHNEFIFSPVRLHICTHTPGSRREGERRRKTQ